MRCTSTGRVCDGYLASAASRREICHVLRRDTNLNALFLKADCFEDNHERRYFDYFRSVTMPKSAKFFGGDFWGRRVLQISHSEPAIKYAVLAISSLHQHTELDDRSNSGARVEYALSSYNNALHLTGKLLSETGKDNSEKGLVACALFICFENLMGAYAAAQIHLQNGLRILSRSRAKATIDRHQLEQDIPDDILQVFSRLDFQAMSFSDSRSPYPSSQCTHHMPKFEPIPSIFSSMGEAQGHLFEILKSIFLPHERSFLDIDRVAIKSMHDLHSASWDAAFEAFLTRLESQGKMNQELLHGVAILQVYRAIVTLTSDASFFQNETCFDAHHHVFERVLTLIEHLPGVSEASPGNRTSSITKSLSLELGVVMPLYYVAANCRDPCLRRRAIAQLENLNHREGVWDSLGAARVAEKIVMIEEGSPGDVQSARSIPEGNRIREIDVVVHIEAREIDLILKRRRNGSVAERVSF